MGRASGTAIRDFRRHAPKPALHDEASAEWAWDAKAETMIGRMIAAYLEANPPPPDSRCADAFEDWSRRLQSSGEGRLPWEPTPEVEAWTYALCGYRMAAAVTDLSEKDMLLFGRQITRVERIVRREEA